MLVGSYGPATHSNCGEPLKLPVTKPTPKGAGGQANCLGYGHNAGRLGDPQPSPYVLRDTGKVQRLDGCGLAPRGQLKI